MSSSRLPTMIKNCRSCIHHFDGKCKKFVRKTTVDGNKIYLFTLDARKDEDKCGLNARHYQYNNTMQTIHKMFNWTIVLSFFGLMSMKNIEGVNMLWISAVISVVGSLHTIEAAICERNIPKETKYDGDDNKDDNISEKK
jgi:hypothetical protein